MKIRVNQNLFVNGSVNGGLQSVGLWQGFGKVFAKVLQRCDHFVAVDLMLTSTDQERNPVVLKLERR
jgi:hypothetical protein